MDHVELVTVRYGVYYLRVTKERNTESALITSTYWEISSIKAVNRLPYKRLTLNTTFQSLCQIIYSVIEQRQAGGQRTDINRNTPL